MEVRPGIGRPLKILPCAEAQSRPLPFGIVADRQGWLPLALGGLTAVWYVALLGPRAFDDPYITFRYAANLMRGSGLVYNEGQRVLSTTAPGYAVLLAALGHVWPDLPALSVALSLTFAVAAAGILAAWGQESGNRAVGMLAGLLLSLSPLLLQTAGAETCLVLTLVLGGFWAWERSHPSLAMAALAAATLIRPDGAIASAALVLVDWLRGRRLRGRPLLLYAALVGGWTAGLWIHFGSPIPVTLWAKRHQATVGTSNTFAAGFFRQMGAYARQPLYWLHGTLALLGLWQVIRHRRWAPLMLWTALYFLAYVLLGVTRYFWYYAPLVPALVVLIAEGAVAVGQSVQRFGGSGALARAATMSLVVGLVAPMQSATLTLGWRADPRVDTYREIGQWLASNTPRTAAVGATEIGVIGYHAQRTMIDFAGILQPDVARQLARSGSYQATTQWAVARYQPDYVLLQRSAMDGADLEWFRRLYVPLKDWTNGDAVWLTLYGRAADP